MSETPDRDADDSVFPNRAVYVLALIFVVMGVIIIGIIGYAIDILMRQLEAKLIPWKGKG